MLLQKFNNLCHILVQFNYMKRCKQPRNEIAKGYYLYVIEKACDAIEPECLNNNSKFKKDSCPAFL